MELMFCPAKLGISDEMFGLCNIRPEYAGELTFRGNDTSQLACFVAENFRAVSPKRCYLGEGYGTLDRPGVLKGAISEKEIIIFEL